MYADQCGIRKGLADKGTHWPQDKGSMHTLYYGALRKVASPKKSRCSRTLPSGGDGNAKYALSGLRESILMSGPEH